MDEKKEEKEQKNYDLDEFVDYFMEVSKQDPDCRPPKKQKKRSFLIVALLWLGILFFGLIFCGSIDNPAIESYGFILSFTLFLIFLGFMGALINYNDNTYW